MAATDDKLIWLTGATGCLGGRLLSLKLRISNRGMGVTNR
jgi:hypothetical protein